MNVGLALSGGGARGDFQLGALKYLYEEAHITPSVISGVSVGAVNGAMLTHGHDRIGQLESIWRGLVNNDSFYGRSTALDELARLLDDEVSEAAFERWIRELATRVVNAGSTIGGLTFALGPVGFVLGLGIAAGDLGPTVAQILRVVEVFTRTQSLYQLNPTRVLADAHLDHAVLASSGIELRMGMVGLESGALRFVDQHGRFVDDGEGPVDIVDAIIASSSIPFAFPPVVLGRGTYVDGGVREVCPVRAAVEAGAEYVWAIPCSALVTPPVGSFAGRGILDIALRSTDLMAEETLQADVDPDPDGWGREVQVVLPEINVHDALHVDPVLIDIAIDYGWMGAADTYRRSLEPVPSDAAVDLDEHFFVRSVQTAFSEPVFNTRFEVPDNLERYRDEVRKLHADNRRGLAPYIPFNAALIQQGVRVGGRVFLGIPEQEQTLADRLRARLALRPRSRAEQLATLITALRMQLTLLAALRTASLAAGVVVDVGPEEARIREQIAEAVRERRTRGAALPTTADSWAGERS